MKVHFIRSSDGDWVAMYLDGKKVAEGHSLDIVKVALLCGAWVSGVDVDVDEFDPDSAFPEILPDNYVYVSVDPDDY
jgi:hypothetical protein